jgi:glycosyltransferase involved in cell wall biosynthesis
MKKRVALITHETSLVGGLPTMVTFLYRTLLESGRYEPEIISLATSASDRASLQLRSPATWLRQPKIEHIAWHELVFKHVGAWGSELEFQRYRPRRMLTELLKGFDLLQFVVGSPPWVCVAEGIDRPVFLWTATTTRADRTSQMQNGSLIKRTWSSAMVPITECYERRALKACDSIYALSDYTRSAIEPVAGAGKVVLAPCGIDTELFKPAPNLKDDYILCVARLSDPRKNVGLLLNAYARVKQKLDETPDLYLVGDPPSTESQSQLQRVGIADKVHLLGPKHGEELADLYRNAGFFVLSSNEEGLGIVILEAMASGLPVISTACGGPATAISEGITGMLTPVDDAGALANAMEALLRDPALCARMGKEGRRVAAEHFSLAVTGKVFLDRYDNVMKDPLSEPKRHPAVGRSFSAAPAALPEP